MLSTIKGRSSTATFTEDDGRPNGISDKELMGLVVGSVAGHSARAETVLLIGVGNLDAV